MEILDFINFVREVTKNNKIYLVYDFPFDRVVLKENKHEILDLRLSESSLELVFIVKNSGSVMLKRTDSFSDGFPNMITCAIVKELRVDLREPLPKLHMISDHDISHPFLKVNGNIREINTAKFSLDHFRVKSQVELICNLEAERLKLQYAHKLYRNPFGSYRFGGNHPEPRKQFFEYLSENNVDFDPTFPENFVLRTYMDTVNLLTTHIKGKNAFSSKSVFVDQEQGEEEEEATELQKEGLQKALYGLDNTLAALKWQLMLDTEFESMEYETDDVLCVIKKKQ